MTGARRKALFGGVAALEAIARRKKTPDPAGKKKKEGRSPGENTPDSRRHGKREIWKRPNLD